MKRILAIGLLILLGAASFAGCGDEPSKPTDFIHLSPVEHTLGVGEGLQLTATVLGTTNFDVVWTVLEGDGHGTVSRGGRYTAPNTVPTPARATIRGASAADTTKTAESVITIVLPELAVSVEPGADTVHVGLTRKFSARVEGAAVELVTWSVDEGPAFGSVDAKGLYAAPPALPDPPAATLRATSVADPTKSGAALVTLYLSGPPPPGFVRVPAGTFLMGDGDTHCSTNEYAVTLTKDFYLGQTEVTNEQYREMLQWAYDHGYVTASTSSVTDALGSDQELVDLDYALCEIMFRNGKFSLRDVGYGLNPDHPILWMNWYGAAGYCNWLSLREGLPPAYDHVLWLCHGGDPYRAWGYRLPTEAEWEYAAQYDDERLLPWGDAAPTPLLANYYDAGIKWTTAVASYPAEKTIDGVALYDMAGNLWEWCNDWYQCRADPDLIDPPGPRFGVERALRGGGYTALEHSLHCAGRWGFAPDHNAQTFGFRVARTANR